MNYITDVRPENGPHIYVRKSHRNQPMRDQLSPFRSQSSQHINAKYGRDNLAVMHGPAGTGFVEDPYGYHTGTAVTGASRLMLEIQYGVSRMPLADGPFFCAGHRITLSRSPATSRRCRWRGKPCPLRGLCRPR